MAPDRREAFSSPVNDAAPGRHDACNSQVDDMAPFFLEFFKVDYTHFLSDCNFDTL